MSTSPNVSSNGNGNSGPGERPKAIQLRRDPKPFIAHVAVDAVIAFCATAFLFWVFGEPLWMMIVVAWVLGLIAAPVTRRWEQRQLDERATTT